MNQTVYLIKLILKLKRFRCLWIILVIISMFSNHFMFPIVDGWMGNYGRTLSKMNAKEFIWNSDILLDARKYLNQLTPLLMIIIDREKVNGAATSFFKPCSGATQCWEKSFRSFYGQSNSGKYVAYVDYQDPESMPRITCQVALGADLNCPFFGHLVASTKNYTLFRQDATFGKAQFFSLTGRAERRIAATSASSSSCAMHENFDPVISKTIMVQTMLFIFSTFLYFLVSTVSCVLDLRKHGFLRIMFQKGLSVRSYWTAVWSLSSLEIVLIAILYTFSHWVQCPGFYRAASMLSVFIATICHLYGIAALALLLSVVLRKYFHIGLVMVLIAICTGVVVLINKMLLTSTDSSKIALLLAVPLGHFGEFTQAHLLTVILPDSLKTYHHLILAVNILFPLATVAVTLYLDYILESGNGYCLEYGYPLDKRFWTYRSDGGAHVPTTDDPLASESPPDMANVEAMTEDLAPIVRISQVSRHFAAASCCLFRKDKDIVALSNISAHIYESHITAIIGHNGSGKTTLLNILNGTDLPTHGRVSVDGLLVTDPINRMRLRRIIGICPQENSLSSALTVQQTLEMAQVSCNREDEDASMEIEDLLDALHLTEKKDAVTSKISGGSKRKLCTAVALIGDCKVLFLDEPTSGVDPVSRRRVWKLLQEYKLKCSIILSTQSMDEADTLADRKIFLSGGSLICAGSSLFLKSAFDCGFDFNVSLKSATHAPLIIRQVQQDFKSVRVRNKFQKSVDFHLPASDLNELPALAQALERRKDWILAFGLMQASLYDIFMRLRDLQPAEVEDLFKEGRIGLLADEEDDGRDGDGREKRLSSFITEKVMKTNSPIILTLRAMAYINVIRVWRSRVKLCSRIVTPTVLLAALFIVAFVEKSGNNSQLQIHNNLTHFGDAFQGGVCVFLGSSGVKVSNSMCQAVFQESSMNHSNKGNNFLALEMPDVEDPYTYLVDAARMKQIKSLCHSPGKSPVECPIVYVDNWTKTVLNAKRTVFVGSFSTFENFNSSAAASVTIGAYYRLMRYFLAEDFNSGKLSALAFKYLAKSVYEFRSMFIPLYGIFFQLVIISILPATFLDDLIEDKETRVRNQLSSIGMSTVSYWITMYLVHWLQYAIIYLISVIFVVAINSNGYANSFYLAGIVLPTLIFGLSNNQLTVYILSSLLKKSNPTVTVAYFFFSVFLVIIVLAVQLDNVAGVILIALVPPYSSIALTFYGTKAIFYTLAFFGKTSMSGMKAGLLRSVYFSQPHILASMVAVIIHSLLLPVLLILLEQRDHVLRSAMELLGRVDRSTQEQSSDPGVMEEIQSLENDPRNADHLLETRHLRMTFPNGAKVVRDVTFAASPGEIFGLLGPNGAGKSTTMAIMVGDLRATGGHCEVHCGQRWLSSRVAASRGYIGYCPQYNPQYDDVTAREHLEFYACILGVSKADAKEEIDLLIQSLSLDEHENKLTSQLSFGCKRRLSLAASLLGDPCLLVIDEASTGVDPEGKRVLWRAVRALASHHHSIIISTHSMEEAEALCSRVSVMNHGLLVGLGSVQQLKSRYGQSYTLEVLIASARGEPMEQVDQKRAAVVDAVTKKFANSSVVEEFTSRVTFSIPTDSIGRLSTALSWLAEIKKSMHILYFSFYQMSLDQVFGRMIVMHNRVSLQSRRDSASSSSELDNIIAERTGRSIVT